MAEAVIIYDAAPTGGGSSITVKGVKGKACTKLTEAIEKTLGKKTGMTPTMEMHEVETAQNKLRA